MDILKVELEEVVREESQVEQEEVVTMVVRVATATLAKQQEGMTMMVRAAAQLE